MGFLFKRSSPEKRAAEQAVKAAQNDPSRIAHARDLIDEPGLSNQDRIELYRQLADAPRYRNQRDNSRDPESTCNLTSMAMAFEGLGMNLGDSSSTQGEEKLYSRFYQRGGSRIDEHDRAGFARSMGLDCTHLTTPAFGSGADAQRWFEANVVPHLHAGAQATLGIKSGSFRHVVRLQWVERGGIRIDDPYGQAVGTKGQFGYAQKNTNQRDTQDDQQGTGDDCLLDWETVAKVVSNRYVQLYNEKAPKARVVKE